MSRHNTAAIHASHALLDTGWAKDVRILVEQGRIVNVLRNVPPETTDVRSDLVVPGAANLHSHCFQRGMAGMTEYRARERESFWTWREIMYKFVAHLSPEDVGSIAAMAFVEMLEEGYSSVGEFHYLHHQADGTPYDQISELSGRIVNAAEQTGIGLTLLPVFYAFGGAREQPLKGGQLRFGNSFGAFCNLHQTAGEGVKRAGADFRIGIAPHSLRAVNPDLLNSLVHTFPNSSIHMHIAEQVKEVEEISAWLGQRPVEWLLDHCEVSANWCLIHATHMTGDETRRMARSGSIAGLCPITEANLGDGIFNAATFLDAGGQFGVGTDSNVDISLSGELRLLEYGQRLKHQVRNALCEDGGSTGEFLHVRACKGGAQALGRECGAIKIGAWADLVGLDREHPALHTLDHAQILDGWIFGRSHGAVCDVWSAGRHVVRQGHHIARERIATNYQRTMAELRSKL